MRDEHAVPTSRPWWLAAVAAIGVALLALLTLAWLGDAVRERNGLTGRDPGVLDFFIDIRSGWLVSASRIVTDFASVPVVLALAALAGWFLWRRGAPLVWALTPAASVIIAGAATTIGKQAFDRSRPPVSVRLIAEHEPSFPSGHTSDGTALYLAIGLVVAVVFLRRPAARVATVAAAGVVSVVIGLSRLELGVHWPTDVVAGWALGTGAVAAVTALVVVVSRFWVGPSSIDAMSRHP